MSKKILQLDLNKFPTGSSERETFAQIQDYLLALDNSNSVKNDLKTLVIEGVAPASNSAQAQPIINVPGVIYGCEGMTETPTVSGFSFKRWVPIDRARNNGPSEWANHTYTWSGISSETSVLNRAYRLNGQDLEISYYGLLTSNSTVIMYLPTGYVVNLPGGPKYCGILCVDGAIGTFAAGISAKAYAVNGHSYIRFYVNNAFVGSGAPHALLSDYTGIFASVPVLALAGAVQEVGNYFVPIQKPNQIKLQNPSTQNLAYKLIIKYK
jgi:hypothetical protein